MPLADAVLIVHFLYVLFVVGSLPLIWIGAWLKLKFVRHNGFRFAHLAAILYVVGESLAGIVCPLTALENKLRQVETETSFIQYWLHQIIFYNIPENMLTVIYILFALLVAATLKYVPPNYFRKP